MKEQLVSFETADLAKRMGFEGEVRGFFSGTKLPLDKDNVSYVGKDQITSTDRLSWSMVGRPTQSLLQKWLREKHGVYINITPMTIVGHVVHYKSEVAVPSMVWDEAIKIPDGTYEVVLEKSLQKALELI